jgi:hypothetical protein
VDLAEIRRGVSSVEKAIDSFIDNGFDEIKNKLTPTREFLKEKIPNLEKDIKEINELYQNLVKYLCEDPKEKSDEVGKRIVKMWNNCEQCIKDLEKERLLAKKELEKRERENAKNKKLLQNEEKKMKLPIDVKGTGKLALETIEINKRKEEKDAKILLDDLKKKREEKSDKFFIFSLLKNIISFILLYLFIFLNILVNKTKSNGINVMSFINSFSKKMKKKIKHGKISEGGLEKEIFIKAKQEKQIEQINKDLIKSLLS